MRIPEDLALVPTLVRHVRDDRDAFGRVRAQAAGVIALIGFVLTLLLNELERTGGRWGLQTMCEGGGLANATVIERLA